MHNWNFVPGSVPEDDHRRTANDVEADRLIAARRALLLRFLPFVRLEDQNLAPVELLKTVARRLYDEADHISEMRLLPHDDAVPWDKLVVALERRYTGL